MTANNDGNQLPQACLPIVDSEQHRDKLTQPTTNLLKFWSLRLVMFVIALLIGFAFRNSSRGPIWSMDCPPFLGANRVDVSHQLGLIDEKRAQFVVIKTYRLSTKPANQPTGKQRRSAANKTELIFHSLVDGSQQHRISVNTTEPGATFDRVRYVGDQLLLYNGHQVGPPGAVLVDGKTGEETWKLLSAERTWFSLAMFSCSPNNRIAVVLTRGMHGVSLELIDLQTTQRRPLEFLSGSLAEHVKCAWSPDSKRFALLVARGEFPAIVMIFDAATGKIIQDARDIPVGASTFAQNQHEVDFFWTSADELTVALGTFQRSQRAPTARLTRIAGPQTPTTFSVKTIRIGTESPSLNGGSNEHVGNNRAHKLDAVSVFDAVNPSEFIAYAHQDLRSARRLPNGDWLVFRHGNAFGWLTPSLDPLMYNLVGEKVWLEWTHSWRTARCLIERRKGSAHGPIAGLATFRPDLSGLITWSDNHHYVGWAQGSFDKPYRLEIFSLKPTFPLWLWQPLITSLAFITLLLLAQLRRRYAVNLRRK